jgi:hemoglobin-like flavoprotein
MMKKLVVILAATVNYPDRVDRGVPTVKAWGERHASYGVTTKHYEQVGTALLWILEQALLPTAPAGDAAWTETCTVLTGAMRRAVRLSALRRSGAAGPI